MRWLRGFFRNGDPIVRLTGGFREPEAQMQRELLERAGVPVMVKDVVGGSATFEVVSPFGFTLFVKQSDVDRAEEVLGLLKSENPGGQANG